MAKAPIKKDEAALEFEAALKRIESLTHDELPKSNDSISENQDRRASNFEQPLDPSQFRG